jgi:hypothetical protein
LTTVAKTAWSPVILLGLDGGCENLHTREYLRRDPLVLYMSKTEYGDKEIGILSAVRNDNGNARGLNTHC